MAFISFDGRITGDAEIKYSDDGKPRASFSVAENFRQLNKNTNQWEDSGVTFHRVTVFGRIAEAGVLTKGALVNVSGTQKSRAYTNQQGEQKQWTEVTTNTVGVVPIPQQQSSPRPSPQGESWNAQPTPPQQWGGQQQGWPQTAQPGQGQRQDGFDTPPF